MIFPLEIAHVFLTCEKCWLEEGEQSNRRHFCRAVSGLHAAGEGNCLWGPCQASGGRSSPPQCWFSCSVTQRTQKEQGESRWLYFTSKSQCCLHRLGKLGATGEELPGQELAARDPESQRTENESCKQCLEPRGASEGPRMFIAPDNTCSTKTGNKMWIRWRWMGKTPRADTRGK